MNHTRTLKICAAVLISALAGTTAYGEILETRIGKLELERGLPTKEFVAKLFEAQEFQRATQAYIWGLPLVGMAEWQRAHDEIFGAKDGDIVIYANYRDKLGILTANNTTPYLITFVNLDRTGPFVVDLPAGPNASSILDFGNVPSRTWGRQDRTKAREANTSSLDPASLNRRTLRAISSCARPQRIYGRASALFDPDPAKAQQWIDKVSLYPYTPRANPPKQRFLTPGGKSLVTVAISRPTYWSVSPDIINQEPVQEPTGS